MRGTLRGAIPSCILHAALHCCLSMLMLQMMMPHRCYYVLMACIDVTMHLMACSTASTTPHCLACCMCMHRLPMCISGRERWGWALELRSEVTLKFCTYESCSISKYTVVWGPRWYHFFDFLYPKFPDFQVPDFQKSGLGPAWARAWAQAWAQAWARAWARNG